MVLESARRTYFTLTPITAMPDRYHKRPSNLLAQLAKNARYAAYALGIWKYLGRSTVWEVVIHPHRLESSGR